MSSQTYRVRLDDTLGEELRDFCQDWHQPVSTVIRDAVRLLLRYPGVYPAILDQRLGPVVEYRTPKQIAAAERYLHEMMSVDLEQIAAQLGPQP